MTQPRTPLSPASVAELAGSISEAVNEVVKGKPHLTSMAVLATLARGHILIEDVPGVGKTTAAKALGVALGGRVKRIQCTPDLLPSDITGSSVYNQKTGDFEFRPGPIFGNVVVADEINRAEPKTQSALLECMEEHQATVDGTTYRLPNPFTVVATQNPHDMQGTFALPEAQRDRFMMRLAVGYPDHDAELSAVTSTALAAGTARARTVTSTEQVAAAIDAVNAVVISESVGRYIVRVLRSTREHGDVALGASTRAVVHLGRACRAYAAMSGRGHVLPDDVKALALPVLAHRLVLAPHAASRGQGATDVIRDVLSRCPVDDRSARG